MAYLNTLKEALAYAKTAANASGQTMVVKQSNLYGTYSVAKPDSRLHPSPEDCRLICRVYTDAVEAALKRQRGETMDAYNAGEMTYGDCIREMHRLS